MWLELTVLLCILWLLPLPNLAITAYDTVILKELSGFFDRCSDLNTILLIHFKLVFKQLYLNRLSHIQITNYQNGHIGNCKLSIWVIFRNDNFYSIVFLFNTNTLYVVANLFFFFAKCVIIFIYMNEFESKTQQIVHFKYTRKDENTFLTCTFWKLVTVLILL